MADKRERVELVLPNGNTVKVGSHMIEMMSRFGAVPVSSRSIKTPPKELLNMPAPRKVVLPTLEDVRVIEPAVPVEVDYPVDPVNEPVVKKPVRRKK